MRTTDERLTELNRRSKQINRKKQIRNDRIAVTSALCVCFLMIFSLSWLLPGITPENTDIEAAISGAASIFQNTGYLKFIIIGIVSFVLGCSVTLLCVILHRRRQEDDSDD